MASGLQTTGTLNETTLSDFVDIERKEFSIIQKMVEPKAKQLYITDNVENHTGNTKQYKEVDTETFARLKREGENSAVASVGVGYEKTMTFRRFAMEIVITKEMRDDNEDPQIMGKLLSLNHFVPQRMELDLTHTFTFATSTSYTDQDGDTIDTTVGDGYALTNSALIVKAILNNLRNCGKTLRRTIRNQAINSTTRSRSRNAQTSCRAISPHRATDQT